MDRVLPFFEADQRLHPEPDVHGEVVRIAMSSRPPRDRAQFVIDLAIFTDELERGEESIEAMMQRAGIIALPGGGTITGEGGTGKSFIIARMLKRYPPRHLKLTSFVPIVAIRLDERPSPEDVKKLILKNLGHVNAKSTLSAGERAEDVINGLRACQACALLIDEAHHLNLTSGSSRNSDRIAGPVGEYLLKLHDEVKIPFIFAGTPSLKALFDRDKQLSTRWPGCITLSNYANDAVWRELLDAIDSALPMLEKAGLKQDRQADHIHQFTRGNFRVLKMFLSEAVRLAAIDHSIRLEEEHLRRAHYLMGLPAPNPFGEHQQ